MNLGLKHGRYFHPPIRSSVVSFFRSSVVPFVIRPIKIATIKSDSKIVLSPTSLTVAPVLSLLRARSSIVRNYYSQRRMSSLISRLSRRLLEISLTNHLCDKSLRSSRFAFRKLCLLKCEI